MTEDKHPQFELTVAEDQEGQRLDAFLTEQCPDHSRSRIQTDIKSGQVQVDGRQRPKSFQLKIGAVVTYTPAAKPELVAKPQDIPLDIVYQDDEILIVNKPVGLVVHPAIGHPDGTLVNALLHHCKGLAAGGDPLRPGIVHRLDRDTSGLLAVALTERAHHHLGDQLRDRRMGRTYRALSWGSWDESAGKLTGDIGRHAHQRPKMAVVERDGRPAVTHYEVLEDFGFVQHCQVKLETGRTHQIRVHFTHNHHPIVGDPLYGDDRRAKGVHPLDRRRADRMVRAANRQMLHAAELRLIHPVTDQALTFTQELPADMARILDHLRADET